jgi:outer membrane immunogenic protein
MIRIMANAIALATAVISICGTANAIEKKTKPVPVDPLHQWTGFYVGGNIGYGIAGLTDNGPLAVTTNMTGVVGGVQAGYNYQYQHLVVGVEADVQASNQQTSYTRTLPIVGDFTVSQKIPYFMTARGRLGFAFQCGCVMAYGTAGIGYGAYEPSASVLGFTVSRHYERAAFVAGAGVEWMVWGNWSAKLEALYGDTGNIGSPIQVPLVGPVSMRLRDAITRIGVNYHF